MLKVIKAIELSKTLRLKEKINSKLAYITGFCCKKFELTP